MYGVQLEYYEDFLVAFSVCKVIYLHKEVFFKFHSSAIVSVTYQTHIVTTARPCQIKIISDFCILNYCFQLSSPVYFVSTLGLTVT